MLRHSDNTSHRLLRHPSNTNLHLYHQPAYHGLPLMIEKGPFVEECLSRLQRVIERALIQYPRVMAFRVDLNLPRDVGLSDYADTNTVISRFIESFCSKIEYHRTQLREQKRDTRDCTVRYAWAREVGTVALRPCNPAQSRCLPQAGPAAIYETKSRITSGGGVGQCVGVIGRSSPRTGEYH